MEKIIRMNQLVKILGISRSSIHRLQAQGDFVPKIRIGTRSVGYSVSINIQNLPGINIQKLPVVCTII